MFSLIRLSSDSYTNDIYIVTVMPMPYNLCLIYCTRFISLDLLQNSFWLLNKFKRCLKKKKKVF